MKKKFAALLTAILCMTAAVSAVPASAVDAKTGIGESYTISTDTFTYTSQYVSSSFYFESELADPDFLVVGIEYYKSEPDKIAEYIVSPIIKSDRPCEGVGRIWSSTVKQELGDIELHIGDLLKFDGGYSCLECNPPIYTINSPHDVYSDPTTVIYLGNGTGIFGEEFEKVIHTQIIIDQIILKQEGYEMLSDIEIYWGDVTVHWGDVNLDDELDILDCISVNKYLLGSSNFCFYTKNLADVNMDGKLDSTDSLCILKEVVGLTTDFK